MTFDSLYVNNNGNVSFGGPNGTFTPEAFPVSDLRMIAPWWGDVDTQGMLRPPARNGVYWSVTPGQFVATWHNVGYYPANDSRWNDFQLILTAAGPGAGDFDVEFRYNRCDWTTGNASGGSGGLGGTPAQAGFDAGNLRDYVSLPGSLTMAVLNLCTTSNVAIPGVWRFAVRNGDIDCPGYGLTCDSGMPGLCGPGVNRCRSATETYCMPNATPIDDVCNNLDDDCDATVDEMLPTLMCGIGACAVTQPSCVGGAVQTCTPGLPSMERCNLIDDDCNGTTDDMPDVTCGVGACVASVPACVMGVAGVCVPRPGSRETCNGIDDDCNGLIDDGIDTCMFIPDAAVVPDAGTDAAVPMFDGATSDGAISSPDASRTDAGPCRGWACDPNRLNGRAGPGCDCSVAGARGSSTGGLVVSLLAIAALLIRRRRSGPLSH
jgi:MYXO-CTERM domain-containing protein